eukprot:TRINITY_DN1641_c0_g1_i1.p1 TRINITY_DN1641_c0_g1~~TRINITY_DN1641_c0_g1_i1.p1  ORF type:complete len:306 (-),score=62.22 TRINITY_DN1641_c0_g1_i1:125-1042(-)
MAIRFEYDTVTWVQRIPFIFASVLNILVLMLTIRQQMKNKVILKLKYGSNALLLFCISVACTVALRLLYYFSGPGAILTPSILYAICYYTPPLFMIAACVFFLNYLLNSLQSRFNMSGIKRYIIFERVIQITLGVIWFIQVICFSISVYQRHAGKEDARFNCADIYQIINNVAYFFVSVFLIYVIYCYNEKLKLVGPALQNRRLAIDLVIATTFIQVFVRVMNAIFLMSNTYKEFENWSNKKKFPYAQVSYTLHSILAEILPLFAYNYYIEKDTENLGIFELLEPEEESTVNAIDSNLNEKQNDL